MNETTNNGSMAIHYDLMMIWQRVLGTAVNNIDEDFLALGGDQQKAEAMLQEVEAATRRKIQPSAFMSQPTIRHLARMIVANTSPEGIFTCIEAGNGGVPFFFFHGDILGGGFYTRHLARILGPDQPFHVSAPIRLSEHELPRVEDLAARKRRALQKQQPHGPYLLGGFCVGAVVAYEVACQLEAEGEAVAGVLMIEPEIGNALTRSHQRLVNALARARTPQEKIEQLLRGERKIGRLRDVWQGSLKKKADFLLTNSRKLLGKSNAEPSQPSFGEQDVEGLGEWLVPAYHWVLTAYRPRHFSGPATMLLTDQHLAEAPFVLRQWRKVVPHLRVEKIPGQHLTCITTHAAELGKKLRTEIEKLNTMAALVLQATISQIFCLIA